MTYRSLQSSVARANQNQGSDTAVHAQAESAPGISEEQSGRPVWPRCSERGSRRRAEALEAVAGAREPVKLVKDWVLSLF